jgi:hypothetical protein
MVSSFDVVVVSIEQNCKIDKMRSRSDKTTIQTSLSRRVLVICDTAGPGVLGSPRVHALLQGSLWELICAKPRRVRKGEASAKSNGGDLISQVTSRRSVFGRLGDQHLYVRSMAERIEA